MSSRTARILFRTPFSSSVPMGEPSSHFLGCRSFEFLVHLRNLH